MKRSKRWRSTSARPANPVTLSIRPERVSLNGSSESCVNRFSGRVAEFIYLGDHVRVRLEVCGKTDFFVKQPIAELDPALAVGDVVPLGWQVEHVRALDPLLEATLIAPCFNQPCTWREQ